MVKSYFISDQELIHLNQRGFIPGPEESEDQFLKRVEKLEIFFSYPPKKIDHYLTDGEWEGATKITKQLFDFGPDWIIGFYDNRNLSFFQGAATWIEKKEDVSIPLIQLRKKFFSGSFFYLYSREEVLAHEAVHAARSAFHEEKFEEIFAFYSSKNSFRRWMGPLFQKSWEAGVFIALLLIPFFVQISSLWFGFPDFLTWLFLLPLSYAFFLLTRLAFLKGRLNRYLKKLESLLGKEKALQVAFRSKDEEILNLARVNSEEIKTYFTRNKNETPRFRMIYLAYFHRFL
ncbi:MAG: hypothetical protein L0207_01405 [Chlamydiae bacterium]|nr:hypothetical protein [Chlamydiota bacterium]